jgi:putative ubiquitin-RnfH superfamily antitoxin RatB of RatAB toxin-antitoxin module
MDTAELVAVEVVYSPEAGVVESVSLRVQQGSTLAQAIELSGLLTRHAELNTAPLTGGVWGKRCESAQILRDRDRVEIYRPLSVDPKEARRQRYAQHQARFGRKGARG